MSLAQCEDCRLALVRVVFDPESGEGDAWGCQLDDTFANQTRDVNCPFYVGWAQALPAPTRSCKKSQGKIDGCSTGGSCGSCGGSCGSGGCGVDPVAALEAKWDPEMDVDDAGFHEAAIEAWRTMPDHPDHEHEHDHDHDHDHAHGEHPHGREQVGEGPTQGDTRHRPGGRGTDLTPEPAPAVAPGVQGDPRVPEGRAEEPPDDGFPTEGLGQGTQRQADAACSALKALERMGLGSDESAPVPVPLDD